MMTGTTTDTRKTHPFRFPAATFIALPLPTESLMREQQGFCEHAVTTGGAGKLA
jgi:hypothetical protein